MEKHFEHIRNASLNNLTIVFFLLRYTIFLNASCCFGPARFICTLSSRVFSHSGSHSDGHDPGMVVPGPGHVVQGSTVPGERAQRGDLRLRVGHRRRRRRHTRRRRVPFNRPPLRYDPVRDVRHFGLGVSHRAQGGVDADLGQGAAGYRHRRPVHNHTGLRGRDFAAGRQRYYKYIILYGATSWCVVRIRTHDYARF